MVIPPPRESDHRESAHRPDTAAPVGEALVWASRIMAIGLAMFVPGVIGGWVDSRFGLRLFGPAGFAVGLAAALAWLVRIGNRPQERR